MNRFLEPIRNTFFAGVSWGGLAFARFLADAKPLLEIAALILAMAVSLTAILSWWQTFRLRQLEREILLNKREASRKALERPTVDP